MVVKLVGFRGDGFQWKTKGGRYPIPGAEVNALPLDPAYPIWFIPFWLRLGSVQMDVTGSVWQL